MKPATALFLVLALSLTISGCLSVSGDLPRYPPYPVTCPDTPGTASPQISSGMGLNNSHVHVGAGRSVIGISVKADEISTPSPEAEELFIQGLYCVNNNNRFEEALESLDKTLDIDPTFTEAWYIKGVALHNLGRYQDAQYCFDRAIALEPFNISIWSLKGVTIFDAIMHLF